MLNFVELITISLEQMVENDDAPDQDPIIFSFELLWYLIHLIREIVDQTWSKILISNYELHHL